MRRLLPSFCLLLLAPAARADVKLAPIFGSHMVLQRGMAVPVWGTARPGEKVTVAFLDQKKTTTADKDGQWQVKLDALAAGGPHRLTVEAGKKVELEDVLVGEVWICSGQSNMAWRLRQSENAEKEAESAKYPKIRLNAGRLWQACDPKTAAQFSAVGYYFGRDLHRALGVPIGLVNRSVGGTSARLWVPWDAVEAEAALKPFRAAIQKGTTAARKGKAAGGPGRLYDSLIRPLIPLAIRGVIWYQGESDAGQPDEYAVLFPTLIRSWRKAWGQGEFPFLYVQLAPNGRAPVKPAPDSDGWPRIREVQLRTLSVPQTGMAVIIDGDVGIHPLKKHLPGGRLALAARALAYDEKVLYSGPTLKKQTIEGERVKLTFANVGGGLTFTGTKLKGFEVVGGDGKVAAAEALVDGDTVVVWSQEVAKPVGVRYGWATNPGCNLANKEGLPASPFRTVFPVTLGSR
jgi:sialate O-acetylesterase